MPNNQGAGATDLVLVVTLGYAPVLLRVARGSAIPTTTELEPGHRQNPAQAGDPRWSIALREKWFKLKGGARVLVVWPIYVPPPSQSWVRLTVSRLIGPPTPEAA